MTISNVKPKEAQIMLMDAIGNAIKSATEREPMPLEDIVAVLAYMTGASIKHAGRSISTEDELRRMSHTNIDMGMGGIYKRTSSLIINPSDALH